MHSDEEQAPRGGEEQQGEDEQQQEPSTDGQQRKDSPPGGSRVHGRRVTPAGGSSAGRQPNPSDASDDSEDDSVTGKHITKSPSKATKRSAAAQLKTKTKSKSKPKTQSEARSKTKATTQPKQQKSSSNTQSTVNTRHTTRDHSYQANIGNKKSNEGFASEPTTQNTGETHDSRIEPAEKHQIDVTGQQSNESDKEDSSPEQSDNESPNPVANKKRADEHKDPSSSKAASQIRSETLRKQFVELRTDFCVDAATSAQIPAEIRYLDLAANPLNDFLTVIRRASINSDGILVKEPPVVKLVQKTGVAWKGQPVKPSDPTGFPLESICAIDKNRTGMNCKHDSRSNERRSLVAAAL